MGGGAMLSPFTTPPSLSSICNIPFEESWTKCRCIDHESSSKIPPDIESFDQKGTIQSPYDSAFGSVPSRWEVENAMSDLQSFMSGCYAPKEEMNWFNAIQDPHQSTLQQSPGYARLYDAFHMLQNEPATRRLVLSIACDEAIWEAMMNNKAVQDLQGSLISSAKEEESQKSTGQSDTSSLIVKRIMDITTSKLAGLLQSIGSLLSQIFSEMFEPSKKEKPTSELSDLLEEKIRSSFLLSVVLLMIVVMTRSQGA